MGAEIGVWRGQTSGRVLKARRYTFMILVDRWTPPPPGDSYFEGSIKIARLGDEELEAAYQETLRRVEPYMERVEIFRMLSVEAANRIEDQSLDYVFIDADHSYDGCVTDIRAWLPKVRPDGWIGGHDYDHPEQGEVKKAVDEIFGNGIELSYNRTWFREVTDEDHHRII